jgi:hypothetical protein
VHWIVRPITLNANFATTRRSPTHPEQVMHGGSRQGGWGLDGAGDDAPKRYEEDEEDNFDQAQASLFRHPLYKSLITGWSRQLQAVVERMVGMEPSEQPMPEHIKSRRRMT